MNDLVDSACKHRRSLAVVNEKGFKVLGRRIKRVAAVTVSVIALSAGSALAANAAVTKPAGAKPYLPLLPASQACGQKPDTSAGGWSCYVKPSIKKQLLAGKAATPAAAPAASDQYCDSNNNCWVRNSSGDANFYGGLQEFGYRNEVLGYTYLQVHWALHGTNTSENAALTVYDDDVQYIVWDGYLGNSAPGKPPSGLRQCPTKDGPAEVAAGAEVQSPAGWCTESDNANYNHYMNLQASFQTSADGDTGYWYTNASSIVAHSAHLPATTYGFDGPSSLPGSPVEAGYRA
jgi:hypothetical protein